MPDRDIHIIEVQNGARIFVSFHMPEKAYVLDYPAVILMPKAMNGSGKDNSGTMKFSFALGFSAELPSLRWKMPGLWMQTNFISNFVQILYDQCGFLSCKKKKVS